VASALGDGAEVPVACWVTADAGTRTGTAWENEALPQMPTAAGISASAMATM
jgi:hypothetical protein